MNNRTKNTVFTNLIFLFFLCFPAVAKERTPEWVTGWKSAFPDSAYIAQRGEGKSAELAQTDALSAIARYLKSEVQATLSTSVSTSGENESVATQEDVTISSQLELFGTEFTEPYKQKKTWYCVAYIDRAKAWEQLLPGIREKETVFCSFWEKAQADNEPFRACLYYKNAWNAAQDFFKALDKGRLINPKADEIFSQSKTRSLSVPSLIDAQKKDAAVRIVCSGDSGGIIKTALAQKFAQTGFTVSDNAKTTAEVQIEMNEEGSEPVAVRPSLTVTVRGKTGEMVYSFQCRAKEKTAAYSLETAKRRALPKLAQTAGEQFLQDYERILP